MDRSALEECVSFFRKNRGYARLFEEMRKKYKKYGKLAGKVSLEGASEEECLAIGGILGRNLPSGDLKVSLPEFEAALNETKYRGVSVTELLFVYFGGDILTNSQRRKADREERESFKEGLLGSVGKEFGEASGAFRWLSAAMEQKRYGWQLIGKEREGASEEIRETVLNVCRAAEALPFHREGDGIRLAVLAAEVTKNPHYFDRGQAAGRLLLACLSFLDGTAEPKSQEEVLALYYRSGIRPDDISSFTTCYGIHFYTEEGEHEAYRSFMEYGEKYVLTLSNLSRIMRADSRDKRVFVLENQMVFSQICERLQGKEYALLCTSGQMKTASLILIDLLIKSGCRLYYCGDTDPEGIEIADRVAARAPGQVTLWRMGVSDYYRSISNEALTEARLKKLDKIRHEDLQGLCGALRKERRAGYQEHLLEVLFEDIVSGPGPSLEFSLPGFALL